MDGGPSVTSKSRRSMIASLMSANHERAAVAGKVSQPVIQKVLVRTNEVREFVVNLGGVEITKW